MKKSVISALLFIFIVCVMLFTGCDDTKDVNSGTSDTGSRWYSDTTSDTDEGSSSSSDTVTECVHSYGDWIEAKDKTCTTDGNIKCRQCTKCQKYFNEDGTEISLADTVIKAAHIYEEGYCTECGALKPSEGLNYSLNSDKQSYYVTGIGSCTNTEIVIPSTYKGLPVTNIGDVAFYGCTSLKSITIPDSVMSIGINAFDGCTGLTKITLPFVGATKDGTSNTYFGYIFGATSYSSNSDYVPESLKIVVVTGGTSIDNVAFYGCTSLKSITIPDSVTSIGYYAFSGCISLASITIPDSVTSIGSSAFKDCTSLTSITLPFVGATKDGTSNWHFGYIFGAPSYPNNINCVPESLKTVVITGGTRVGYAAFYDCRSLTSVTFKNTSGWYVSTSSTATSRTAVDVTDASQNVTYLTSTYYDYYWKRS